MTVMMISLQRWLKDNEYKLSQGIRGPRSRERVNVKTFGMLCCVHL